MCLEMRTLGVNLFAVEKIAFVDPPFAVLLRRHVEAHRLRRRHRRLHWSFADSCNRGRRHRGRSCCRCERDGRRVRGEGDEPGQAAARSGRYSDDGGPSPVFGRAGDSEEAGGGHGFRRGGRGQRLDRLTRFGCHQVEGVGVDRHWMDVVVVLKVLTAVDVIVVVVVVLVVCCCFC